MRGSTMGTYNTVIYLTRWLIYFIWHALGFILNPVGVIQSESFCKKKKNPPRNPRKKPQRSYLIKKFIGYFKFSYSLQSISKLRRKNYNWSCTLLLWLNRLWYCCLFRRPPSCKHKKCYCGWRENGRKTEQRKGQILLIKLPTREETDTAKRFKGMFLK